jgi:ferric-dicitrate binding protein FerR (iron transport regulator)
MDEGAYRTAYLIAGFIRQTLTEKEHDELDEWVAASDSNMQLFEDLTDEDSLTANLEWMDQVQTEKSYQSLKQNGAFEKPDRTVAIQPVWIAAAVVLLLGIFFLYRYTTQTNTIVNSTAGTDKSLLQPGGNRATLTLENGQRIDLSTTNNGAITSINGSHVNKPAAGELVYEKDGSANEAPVIHTLSTPVGGQFQLTLADGTRVWLNAATSLHYPSHFGAGERLVQVDGQAYFEVAKKDRQPFRVLLADSTTVTVTGTHFDVNAYAGEQEGLVTLLEGSVTVSGRGSIEKLLPGEQAAIRNNQVIKRAGVDTAAVTGWKEGLFVFHDAPIEAIMNQVAKWYDAKIVFKGTVKQLFNASISRKEPLLKLLHLLELNGYVHFNIQNNIIYVSP